MLEEQIRKIPLFAELPTDEIAGLQRLFRQSIYPAGQVLFREGEVGDRFSVIIDGKIEIVKAQGTPEERVLAVLGPGESVGEMSLLFTGGRRTASAVARTQATLMDLTPAEFESLLRRQPALSLALLRGLSTRMNLSENLTIADLQEKNRQLAQAYAELQAAQASLVEKEKLEHELRIARNIQEGILPRQMPVVPGYQLTSCWRPARVVSGDYYDFITFPDGRLGLVVADVTGKGIPAALVMASSRTVFLTSAEHFVEPGAVLKRANEDLLKLMPAGMFITCLYILFDPASGGLRIANAGHNLPTLCSPGASRELRATGMPLGLLPGMVYEEVEAMLAPGESLLMYSDGLVEAHNQQGELYGFPRLRQLLANFRQGEALISKMLLSLEEFTGPGWEQEDDVTLLALERQCE